MDSHSYDTELNPITFKGSYVQVCWSDEFKHFMSDFLDGTITNYSFSGFLQNNNDYVVKASYVPLELEHFMVGYTGPRTSNMTLGKVDLPSYECFGFSYWKSYLKIFSQSITRTYNNFLDYSPYTRYYLYVPYFNIIEIEPERVYGHTLDCYLSFDAISGILKLFLYLDDNKLLSSQSIKISIDVPVGKTNAQEIDRNNIMNAISTIGSLVGMGIGAYSGNALITAGSAVKFTSAINNAIKTNIKTASTQGMNGNFCDLGIDKTIRLIRETVSNVTKPNASLVGLPCNQNYTLSLLTGYTKVGNINFNPSGYEIYNDEISEIVELLKSGVIL